MFLAKLNNKSVQMNQHDVVERSV